MKRGTLNREVVIDRALKIVSEDGFNRLTYNGLARSLGVQPQSLYRYVENISEVKSGVIAAYVTQLTDSLTRELLPYSGEEALRHFATYFVSYTQIGIPFTDMIGGLITYRQVPQVAATVEQLRDLAYTLISSLTVDPVDVEKNEQLFLNFVIGTLTLVVVRNSETQPDQQAFNDNVNRILELMDLRPAKEDTVEMSGLFEIPADQTSFATKEVLEITGFTKEALRYYEKLNLLGPIKRDRNNYRQYSQQNLQRMLFVKAFQHLGMDLSTLADVSEDDPPEKHIAILSDYQRSVQDHIRRLTEINQLLEQKIEFFRTRERTDKK